MKAVRRLSSITISKDEFDHLAVITLNVEHCDDPNLRFLKSQLQRAILCDRSVVPEQVVMINLCVSYRFGDCSEIQHRFFFARTISLARRSKFPQEAPLAPHS